MQIRLLFVFLFIACLDTTQGQPRIYQTIDSLIETNTLMNAMTARRILDNELAADSVQALWWIDKARIAWVMYKEEDAKIYIEKAAFQQNQDANVFLEEGKLYNRLGQLSKAAAALNKSVNLKANGKAYYWRGIVYQQLKEPDKAISDYEAAIKLKVEMPELYNNYAIAWAEKGEYEKALKNINKALKLNPQYPEAWSARSKIDLYLFNVDSACKDIERASKLGFKNLIPIPDTVCSGTDRMQLQFAAEFLLTNKMQKTAVKAFTQLIGQYGDVSDYYLNRGFCYYQLKQYDKAEDDYRKALKLPGAAMDLIYSDLELLYFDQFKYEQSIGCSDKRLELDANNPEAYLNRGLCNRRLKKYGEAEEDFNQALFMKANYFRAYGYRAYLFFETGKYEKARQDAQTAVTINPDYDYAYLVLGQAKIKLGDVSGCEDLYKASSLGNENAGEALKRLCTKDK